ncbi:hypothetical protein K461DRAFT_265787 [Myriangium duriaei CBS 260.36]|uniref:BAH domain-containing protein n=1 Tax=Myriangium duriaei CBS 260.36 TaxID=1168546 RepID=A0A9P4J6R7_9PEZI|nr:hypothetical protein K461DRAFT_265787 [Myriangium duriaei CBS 260.36]
MPGKPKRKAAKAAVGSPAPVAVMTSPGLAQSSAEVAHEPELKRRRLQQTNTTQSNGSASLINNGAAHSTTIQHARTAVSSVGASADQSRQTISSKESDRGFTAIITKNLHDPAPEGYDTYHAYENVTANQKGNVASDHNSQTPPQAGAAPKTPNGNSKKDHKAKANGQMKDPGAPSSVARKSAHLSSSKNGSLNLGNSMFTSPPSRSPEHARPVQTSRINTSYKASGGGIMSQMLRRPSPELGEEATHGVASTTAALLHNGEPVPVTGTRNKHHTPGQVSPPHGSSSDGGESRESIAQSPITPKSARRATTGIPKASRPYSSLHNPLSGRSNTIPESSLTDKPTLANQVGTKVKTVSVASTPEVDCNSDERGVNFPTACDSPEPPAPQVSLFSPHSPRDTPIRDEPTGKVTSPPALIVELLHYPESEPEVETGAEASAGTGDGTGVGLEGDIEVPAVKAVARAEMELDTESDGQDDTEADIVTQAGVPAMNRTETEAAIEVNSDHVPNLETEEEADLEVGIAAPVQDESQMEAVDETDSDAADAEVANDVAAVMVAADKIAADKIAAERGDAAGDEEEEISEQTDEEVENDTDEDEDEGIQQPAGPETEDSTSTKAKSKSKPKASNPDEPLPPGEDYYSVHLRPRQRGRARRDPQHRDHIVAVPNGPATLPWGDLSSLTSFTQDGNTYKVGQLVHVYLEEDDQATARIQDIRSLPNGETIVSIVWCYTKDQCEIAIKPWPKNGTRNKTHVLSNWMDVVMADTIDGPISKAHEGMVETQKVLHVDKDGGVQGLFDKGHSKVKWIFEG